jgi:hypothetical protein
VPRHDNLASTFVKLYFLGNSKPLNVDRKCATEEIFDGTLLMVFIVENILQTFSAFRLPLCVVIEGGFLIKEKLVACMSHWHVDKHIVVDGEAHQGTDQFKVDVRLECRTIEPVQLDIFIVLEHA